MTEGKGKKPKSRIIFNKWAIISLILLIIIMESWSEYTWRPSNTKTLNISESEVICSEKKSKNWYRIILTTPSKNELFLNDSYRIEDCEKLKSEIINRAKSAQALKPNGLVLKIYGVENTLYQAERPHFATIWLAFFIWCIILAIIEQVWRKKT